MYLKSATFDGYRNLSAPVEFAHPLSVLVGPNNAGKSNVIDGLRSVLSPDTGWPLRPRRDDFYHGGTGVPQVDEFTVSANFAGLDLPQSGRMLTALDGARDTASLHLAADLPAIGQPRSRFLGGESKSPDVEEWARTAVTYTYLPPLRDAEADMRPGRNNRLVDLISALAGDGPDRQTVVDIASDANAALAEVSAVANSTERIRRRLGSISGPRVQQAADLLFADPVFENVLSTLGVGIGDSTPLSMSQNGLGMNNILYMAVLLAGLTYEHGSDLHVLLVEEPEAHLHPQLQDLLMRFLQREVRERSDVQVIVTTHSPNITAGVRVEQVTTLARHEGKVVGGLVERFDLRDDELDHLARFLDVTKAALLFAHAVILVEGLAEQLLVPLLASELDPPADLTEASVTVVNVGGLAFGPFAALHDDGRLLSRCSIVSDSDPPSAADEDDDEADSEGSESPPGEPELPDPVLSATAQKLKQSENERRRVFLSDKTFEHDLVRAGNWEWAIRALSLLKPIVAGRLRRDDTLTTPELQADALLAAVASTKGRFAQALARTSESVKEDGHPIVVPEYLAQAIKWVCAEGELSTGVAGPLGSEAIRPEGDK